MSRIIEDSRNCVFAPLREIPIQRLKVEVVNIMLRILRLHSKFWEFIGKIVQNLMILINLFLLYKFLNKAVMKRCPLVLILFFSTALLFANVAQPGVRNAGGMGDFTLLFPDDSLGYGRGQYSTRRAKASPSSGGHRSAQPIIHHEVGRAWTWCDQEDLDS